MRKSFIATLILCFVLTGIFIFNQSPAYARSFTISPAVINGEGVPGSSGELPDYTIVNGTSSHLYVTMNMVTDSNWEGLSPASEWFTFTPARFELAPSAEQKVKVSISISPDAEPGDYTAFIQAKGESKGEAGLGFNLTLNARINFKLNPVPSIGQETNVFAFTDIAGHWAEQDILNMAQKGIVCGYTEGAFKPDETITRAEFIKMVIQASGINPGIESNGTKDEGISRQEAAVILAEAFDLQAKDALPDFADTHEISKEAQNFIAALQNMGVIKGRLDGMFYPKAMLSRAEACTMLSRLLDSH